VDGRSAATLDLNADREIASQPVWSVTHLSDTFHALVLAAKSGRIPVDCLEVTTGP
jgi:hypothetical protein